MTVLWPLRGKPQTSWSPGALFMAPRTKGGVQVRYHAGLDLKAGEGDDVIAPEDLTVVDTYRGWDGTAKATLVHTASGRSLLLGCTNATLSEGATAKAGDVVAKIGHYTRTVNGQPVKSSMLHLQVYDAKISASEANKWQSWSVSADKPPHLIDPKLYLDGATVLEPNAGEGGDLTIDVPCPLVDGLPVCLASHASMWADELAKAVDAALASYTAAGWADLPELPPDVIAAVELFNAAADVLDRFKDGSLGGSANAQVQTITQAIRDCAASRLVFEQAATPSAPPAIASSGDDGSGIVVGVAVGVVALVVVGGVLYAMSGK